MGGKAKNIYKVSDKEAGKLIQQCFDEGWLFTIHLRSWGNRRKVADELVEEKFQEDANKVHATRELIDSAPVRAITRVQGEALRFVAGKEKLSRRLSWFNDRTFWVSGRVTGPLDKEGSSDIQDIDAKMVEAKAEIEALKEKLREAYSGLVEKALQEHPKLYNRGDFPDVNFVVGSFGIEWRWQKVTMPLNGAATVVDKSIVERENKKYVDFMKGAVEEHVKAVRLAMGQMLVHLRDTLKDPTKRFQDSTVEKPKEFLEALADMRVPYLDKPFQEIAGDIQDILNKVDGGELRDYPEYRAEVAKALDDVVGVFQSLPIVEIERAVDW